MPRQSNSTTKGAEVVGADHSCNHVFPVLCATWKEKQWNFIRAEYVCGREDWLPSPPRAVIWAARRALGCERWLGWAWRAPDRPRDVLRVVLRPVSLPVSLETVAVERWDLPPVERLVSPPAALLVARLGVTCVLGPPDAAVPAAAEAVARGGAAALRANWKSSGSGMGTWRRLSISTTWVRSHVSGP